MARFLSICIVLLLGLLTFTSGTPDREIQSELSQEEFTSLFEEAWTNERAGRSLSQEKKERLNWYFDELSAPHSLRGDGLFTGPNPFFQFSCTLCTFAINTVLKKYESGASRDELVEYVVNLCVNFKIEPEEVCRGAVELNVDPILYIANNSQVPVTAERMCGVVFQNLCPFTDDAYEWTVDLTKYGEKPELRPFIPNDAGRMKIVQVTDLHYDRNYEVGGNAACDEPACCRAGQGHPTDPSDQAGYWGDYRSCDLPWPAVQSLFENINANHNDADYIMMTGDLLDHGVWATTVETNKAVIRKVMTEMKTVFGDKQIFPILGNHEASPLNVFPPISVTDEKLSINWLYETVADVWSPWLSEDARATILKGGYYTALAKPGLRIIGLHNMACYVFNWWVMYNPSDQDGQLEWLAETLWEAEKKGEKVHILSHVPSGSPDCFKVWSREYRKIINRFENTVVAQFTGHTHHEEIHLYYDNEDPTRPTALSFCGGSGTSFTNVNPNYRVYYVDDAGEQPTWAVVDYESWIYNLTADSHMAPTHQPDWFKMYSFRETFGVDNMTTASIDKLTRDMLSNEELLNTYFRYYVSEGDPFLAKGCDEKCLKGLVCEIVTCQPNDPTQCTQLGLNAMETEEDNSGSSEENSSEGN
ncbi:sphingomyelin phosphodiesterase-like [Ischnura elegans]|uniref:sphingomyelin phosphodiesterase-like n=1 Tax=Ischnura elegans TaxID=197161 RepID=UPI001ED8AFBB|nr:sphingomyelin phosphodiesterase-like [Ischnura elegans]